MKYTAKSFTVPASSAKAPENCGHGWVAKGRCVLCGQRFVGRPGFVAVADDDLAAMGVERTATGIRSIDPLAELAFPCR